MIIELPDTSTAAISSKLKELRDTVGVARMGRILTLVIAPETDAMLEEAIAAATAASHEHPSRIIAVKIDDRGAADARLDAQLRSGGDTAAAEVIVLRLSGPVTDHAGSVVLRFLLPDLPVALWWPENAPVAPAHDPLGKLARRRITDATNSADPSAAIKSRLPGYTSGDTDLAWSRITQWRGVLTSALDQPPHEPITAVVVSGLEREPALDVLAGWLASRIDAPVRRAVGQLRIELTRRTETVTLSRPQDDVTATLSRTGMPDAQLPLVRRDVPECLAEELRRFNPDPFYHSALEGIDRVEYV